MPPQMLQIPKALFDDKKHYRIEKPRDKADTATDIYIFGEIGWEIIANDLVQEIHELKADTITVYLNSFGGYVSDGIAIYNALKKHTATVSVVIQGIAASIASVIAMAGDTIEMEEGSFLMVHKAWGMTIGNADDHVKVADTLTKMDNELASIYARRTGKTQEETLAWMTDETWFNETEAKDAGLVDIISKDTAKDTARDVVLCRLDALMNLYQYKNVPAPLLDIKNKLEPITNNAETKPADIVPPCDEPSKETIDMEIKDLTLDQLKAERPDLVDVFKEAARNEATAESDKSKKDAAARVASIFAKAKELEFADVDAIAAYCASEDEILAIENDILKKKHAASKTNAAKGVSTDDPLAGMDAPKPKKNSLIP